MLLLFLLDKKKIPAPTERVDSKIDHGLDLVLLAHISLDRDGMTLAKGRGDLCYCGSSAVLVDISAHNLCSLGCEQD